MSLLKAVLLGIIQGLTEFLPVSSSGHLAIFKQIFGMEDVGISFDVFLHVGTLVAVFIVYWRDIVQIFMDGIGIVIDAFSNLVEWIQSRKKNYFLKAIKMKQNSLCSLKN